MAEAVSKVGANVPSQDLNGPAVADSINIADKYAQERDKRLRQDGIGQFVNANAAPDRLKQLFEDPWVEAGTPVNNPVKDGGHCRILITGAGFGGILFAIKFIQAGFKAEDIVIVDIANGFGGVWYWNRFPGLMCDCESYSYLPLLEETNYMPKNKYSYGEEIRQYAELLAEKYDLHKRAMFQSGMKSATWSSESKQWKIEIAQRPKGGQEKVVTINSDFVIYSAGILNSSKLPRLEGSETFSGPMLHTSRWRYDITGGSSEHPDLTKLKDKRVGIIGTGGTAVQAVPHLAKWSKELFVFQRTPSAVDERNQFATDAAKWKTEVATGPGWQRKRNENMLCFICDVPNKPDVNLTNDSWSRMSSYRGLIGGPQPVSMETIGEFMGKLHAEDAERQARIRQRTLDTVKDPETAKSLQAYYPGWCKRPCFHDDYLPAFNSPNVTLVDTDGKGVDRISKNGVVVNGREYEIDVLIFSTGYEVATVATGKGVSDVPIIGKDGERLSEQASKGWSTLHGVVARHFPNMFWPGPLQCGVSPSFTFLLDNLSSHVAYMVKTAVLEQPEGKVVIEPSKEAVEDWATKILQQAIKFAGLAGCTPGYLNNEGATDRMSQAEQMLAARGSPWGGGLLEYLDVIEDWRAEGNMRGLEVTA